MQAVITAARTQGWGEDRIHSEHFTAAAVPPAASADGEFEVMIASKGKAYKVAGDRSVVQVLGDAGIAIPTSCEEGVCGTCLTGVPAGAPDHRDAFLTDEEKARNDRFLPCVSRARTRLLVVNL